MSKILIVDDDLLVSMSMSDMLEDLGYCTCEARSAYHAAQLIRTDTSIAMVFTDLHMPGANGYSLADQVRLVRPEVRVVLVTGDASAITANHGLQVLSKPYTDQDLYSLMKEAEAYLH